MKKKKRLSEELDDKKSTIKEISKEIGEKELEIRAKNAKVRRLNDKVS